MLLYVHIPFCKRKCRYCSFVSYEKSESQAERYIENVLKEAKNRKNEFIEPIDTLFIGGGTPSLLSPGLLLYFTDSLFRILEADKPTEFSIESNPGTVTEEWMSAAVKAGMNRLSLGMQALQPKLLNTLGRIHTFADVKTAIRTARRYGVSNINIDLIFGIPGQTHDQWTETLEASLSLHPEHISAYGLIPE
ncbi:MAG: radical SAM protein, partial [Eubacteriales bacterium]